MQTIQALPARTLSATSCPNALLPGVCRALNLRRHQQTRIACTEGVVWITQEGCIDDVFLRRGQYLDLEGPGRVVLSAVEPSVVEFGFPQV